MGSTSSKADRSEALVLCEARRRFIRQVIDARYSLAAAHLSYTDSLKNIGVALRRFAEAEILMESSISTTSANELDKTPSHSSYPSPSPSPSHNAEVSDSPLHVHNESPTSPEMVSLSYMRAETSVNPVTVMVNLSGCAFVEDESFVGISTPPPPPPPFAIGGSWDYFDPTDNCDTAFVLQNELGMDIEDGRRWNEFKGERVGSDRSITDDAMAKEAKFRLGGSCQVDEGNAQPRSKQNDFEISSCSLAQNSTPGLRVSGNTEEGEGSSALYIPSTGAWQVEPVRNANSLPLGQSGSKREKAEALNDLSTEREDPSEFITHRAKNFFASIKDIENRFFRASESGKEVSKMLEAYNIRVGYMEAKGRSSASIPFVTSQFCCCGMTALMSNESKENLTKVITWKRTTSSASSSLRNPLNTTTKDYVSDSGSDFVEESCMFAGSHSSTLDRLYAWERKLYDEVKASEVIRKIYDRQCNQLRHQFAKDRKTQVIDKTRSVVKDLHSRIRVAIHSVDSISKRIEKMRDEELQPQLLELIQGLIRMWRTMVECHHAQYISISLAYHTRGTAGTPSADIQRMIMDQLQQEIERFGLTFTNWVNSLASYVESLNGWLQNCILQPRERSKSRRPFSPSRVVAPPIFVLCRDWSAGIKALPSKELVEAIKGFLTELQHLMDQNAEDLQKKENNGEAGDNADEKNDGISSNLVCCIHPSLTKVLDRLNRFSEASLKMYEDIRQKSEAAKVNYLKYKPVRY